MEASSYLGESRQDSIHVGWNCWQLREEAIDLVNDGLVAAPSSGGKRVASIRSSLVV